MTSGSGNRPRLIITRCQQAGAQVEVFGRFENEPEAAERPLFAKPGALLRYAKDRVLIEDGSGLEEEWGPDGQSRDFGSDIFEELRKGNPHAIFEVFFLAIVLLVAWAGGLLEF